MAFTEIDYPILVWFAITVWEFLINGSIHSKKTGVSFTITSKQLLGNWPLILCSAEVREWIANNDLTNHSEGVPNGECPAEEDFFSIHASREALEVATL